MRPLPFIAWDLHRPITGRENQSRRTHPNLPRSDGDGSKQHPRKRSKRSEKRRLWTEIQTKTRCSVQTRSPFWRGEPRAWEAKTSPRRVGVLPPFRLMRLSVIPKRSSRQERCICGSSRVAAGAGCRSSSSNLLLAFSGEGLPVHRLLLLQPHAAMSILEETKLYHQRF